MVAVSKKLLSQTLRGKRECRFSRRPQDFRHSHCSFSNCVIKSSPAHPASSGFCRWDGASVLLIQPLNASSQNTESCCMQALQPWMKHFKIICPQICLWMEPTWNAAFLENLAIGIYWIWWRQFNFSVPCLCPVFQTERFYQLHNGLICSTPPSHKVT